jgi:hypothetical protein
MTRGFSTSALVPLLLLVVACGGSSGVEVPDGGGGDERLGVRAWEWAPHSRTTPDVDRALDDSATVAAASGNPILLERTSLDRYRDGLVLGLVGETPPDVVLVRPGWLDDLAGWPSIVPLDEVLAGRPELVDGLPAETRAAFTTDQGLMAVPLGGSGGLAEAGLAITQAAVERQRIDRALSFLDLVRERVPPQGVPDVLAGDLDVRLQSGDDIIPHAADVTASFCNIGDVPVADVEIRIRMDGEILGDPQVLPPTDPGAESSVEFSVDLPDAGEHMLTVDADAAFALAESNELNNGTRFLFPGAGGPAPPTIVGAALQLDGAAFTQLGCGYGSYVRVAWDGTNYLVVWIRQLPSSCRGRLVGARVSPAGVVLDPGGFVITPTGGAYESFDLCFGGSHYLVVWQRRLGSFPTSLPNPYAVIEGTRISKAGTVLDGPPLGIEKEACAACPAGHSAYRYEVPVAAWTGSDFLVLYRRGLFGKTQYQEDVLARRVTPTGAVSSTRTTIVTCGIGLQPVDRQSLAFNPGAQEGVLLFDAYDYSNSAQAKDKEVAVWIKQQSGSLTASAPKVVADVTSNGWLRIDASDAAAGNAGNFFGVFEDNLGKLGCPGPDVHGTVLGSYANTAVGYKNALVTATSDWSPVVAWDGTNYTVAYCHADACNAYLAALRVTPTGGKGYSNFFKSLMNGVQEVDLAFGSTNGLVALARETTGSASPSAYSFAIFVVRITRS